MDMKAVQNCLGMTSEQYCQHQFREYCAFVETIAEGWEKVRTQILYSPVFRGFWNNEWARRNREDFLPFAADMDLEVNLAEYDFIHSHERLMHDDEFMERYNNVLRII